MRCGYRGSIRVSTRLYVRVSCSSIPYSYQLHICTYTIAKFHGIIIYPCPQCINTYNNYAPSDIRIQMQGLSSNTGNMERKDTLWTLCTNQPHCNPVVPDNSILEPWHMLCLRYSSTILIQSVHILMFDEFFQSSTRSRLCLLSHVWNSIVVLQRFAPLISYTCACNIPRAPLPAFLLLSYRLSRSVSKLLKVFQFCDAPDDIILLGSCCSPPGVATLRSPSKQLFLNHFYCSDVWVDDLLFKQNEE